MWCKFIAVAKGALAVAVRERLKRMVPAPVRRIRTRLLQALHRRRAWHEMRRSVSGLTAQDQRILDRSFAQRHRHIWTHLDQWIDPQVLQDVEVVLDGHTKFPLRAGTDDLGHILPSSTAVLSECLNSLVRPGDVVIDAGANIGAITLPLARAVGATGRVLAVEMVPRTAQALRQTCALNTLGHVTVFEGAVSDRPGQTLQITLHDTFFGQTSILNQKWQHQGAREATVQTLTLDALSADFDEIGFVKLDLEGAEHLALLGAENMLCKTRALVFESWEPRDDPTVQLVKDAGFEVSYLDGRNLLAQRRDML